MNRKVGFNVGSVIIRDPKKENKLIDVLKHEI